MDKNTKQQHVDNFINVIGRIQSVNDLRNFIKNEQDNPYWDSVVNFFSDLIELLNIDITKK